VLTVNATMGVLANDSDIDGDDDKEGGHDDDDELVAILVGGPEHGSLTLNEDGSFEYTPEADFNGEDEFTYVAFDGVKNSTETEVHIRVNAGT
jgi:VCBS repeat-containing protein